GHILALVLAGLISALSGRTIDDWVVLCIKDVPYIAAKLLTVSSYAISMILFSLAAWMVYSSYTKDGKLTLPQLLSYILLTGCILLATSGMTFFQSMCDTRIDRPENEATIKRLFNITGHGSDSEHCPY